MRAAIVVAILCGVAIGCGESEPAGAQIIRKELGKAQIGAQTVATVDAREIIFQPGEKTGRHRHPCPVMSYLVEGTIRFQVQGEKMQIKHAGEVIYEPAQAVIEQYDNASEKERAKFTCFYLLNGQKDLIEMLTVEKTAPRVSR